MGGDMSICAAVMSPRLEGATGCRRTHRAGPLSLALSCFLHSGQTGSPLRIFAGPSHDGIGSGSRLSSGSNTSFSPKPGFESVLVTRLRTGFFSSLTSPPLPIRDGPASAFVASGPSTSADLDRLRDGGRAACMKVNLSASFAQTELPTNTGSSESVLASRLVFEVERGRPGLTALDPVRDVDRCRLVLDPAGASTKRISSDELDMARLDR